MTLIAFHGKLGSGKDTAGERLAEMVVCPTERLSFAAKLKESAAALLDIPVEDWEKYKNDPDVKIMLSVGWTKEAPMIGVPDYMLEAPNVIREFTAREFLQRYGTESHRDVFGTNFWVEQALSSYDYDDACLTYLTDCRFENEAVATRGLGGYVIEVIGPVDETGSHASEVRLPESLIHFTIDNTRRDDDFADLDRQLASVASLIGVPLNQRGLTTWNSTE